MEKLLIANRGEIAVRLIRAAKELGIKTVAIFAKEDEFAVHRFKADEAYQVGAGKAPIAAYLDIADIIRIAKQAGVDAIHPGYGFLSENDEFAAAVAAAGIKFVGPKVEHLKMFGDKIIAKQIAIKADVPTVPGTDHPVADVAEALAFGETHGYPLFVKSAAGGGGRGMRVVEHEEELKEALNVLHLRLSKVLVSQIFTWKSICVIQSTSRFKFWRMNRVKLCICLNATHQFNVVIKRLLNLRQQFQSLYLCASVSKKLHYG